MSKYRKALVALAGFLAVFSSVLSDGVIAPDEYETALVALATAVSVYFVPNKTA